MAEDPAAAAIPLPGALAVPDAPVPPGRVPDEAAAPSGGGDRRTGGVANDDVPTAAPERPATAHGAAEAGLVAPGPSTTAVPDTPARPVPEAAGIAPPAMPPAVPPAAPDVAVPPRGTGHARPVAPAADRDPGASGTAAPPSPGPAAGAHPAARPDEFTIPGLIQIAATGPDAARASRTPAMPGPPSGPDQARPDASAAAGQVGASLLTLASSRDGGSQISVSLHPKELGAVRVQLELAPDGTARVVVAASEPDTLRGLMANQAHLHAALDAASVPADGRHMSFELAPPSPSADGGGPGAGHHPDASAPPPASDPRAGADMPGSGRQGQDGSGGGGPWHRAAGTDAGPPQGAMSVLTARLPPAGGIDITA